MNHPSLGIKLKRWPASSRLHRSALAPRWWPSWVLAIALYLAGRLPYALRLALGSALGVTLRPLMPRRRGIAQANVAFALPELPQRLRSRIVSAQFRELGIAVLETAASWSISDAAIERLVRLRGVENFEEAMREGRGVLVVSGHFLTLNMATQLASRWVPGLGLYRPDKNPVLEYVIHRGRERQGVRMVSREDMRTPLRTLRDGNMVWFSPDQDHGLTQGAFVEFFHRQAATVTTTARLAQRTGAPVVPFVYRRLPGLRGYEAEFLPALNDFPGPDLVRATRRVNEFIEAQAYLAPSQYLWLHRRFKTRPPGEADVYA
jgi:KDO2-lipid IV(A) lauroyltransferase